MNRELWLFIAIIGFPFAIFYDMCIAPLRTINQFREEYREKFPLAHDCEGDGK